jgi:hypothetical protein
MATQLSDQAQTRLVLATLSACAVRTLDELNPGFRPVFERYLANAYAQMRESEWDAGGVMEALAWTHDFVQKL